MVRAEPPLPGGQGLLVQRNRLTGPARLLVGGGNDWLSALRNLAIDLRALNRDDEAEQVERELMTLTDESP